MCGICGKLNYDRNRPVLPSLIHTMMSEIAHRGPDDTGLFVNSNVGLGHTRLSIIDLDSGKQPISNEDGSIWLVFNGEIYNYQELTALLVSKGHKFRTKSDTEVIAHLYEEYGEEGISKLWGMFAFVLWDQRQQKLLLARDRVGIKPLYYVNTRDALIFGSEIKAILADESVSAEMDPLAMDQFLTYLYVPGERTLFKGISKLPPGHYMTVTDGHVCVKQYWDIEFSDENTQRKNHDYAAELEQLLSTSVRDHMISDVPVGVLLSGGVDSTAVLSYAVEHAPERMSTFTVGFDDPSCVDERPYARLAAQKYGSKHYETTITAKDFLDFLPRYVWHMEEPVCEPPAIALYYVSKLAREHVTVLLSGEGGDEAFAGYQNYRNVFWLETLKRRISPLTSGIATMMSSVGQLPGMGKFRKYAPLMKLPFESYYHGRTADPHRFFARRKRDLCSGAFLERIHSGEWSPECVSSEYLRKSRTRGVLNRMLYVDTKTWLPDDLLIKADKITMANSLELRVPLLDHRVLEFGARLPREHKLRGWTTKYLLKKVLSPRVPGEILDRKKTGFPVPFQSWIRRDCSTAFWDLLTDRKTVERGLFNRKEVESLLSSNSAGMELGKEVFSLAVLELWHRTFVDREQVLLA